MGKKWISKITFVLAKCNRGKDVRVYSPATYGMETWGSSSQDYLEKKRKYWYIHSWTSGNDWFDDINDNYKLNTVLETQDTKKLFKFVEKNYPHCLQSVKDDCEDIIKKHDLFMSWTYVDR